MNDPTFAYFARRYSAAASAEDAAAWAVAMLEAGIETPAILMATNLTASDSPWEADDLVGRAFQELGRAPPTAREALTWQARRLAGWIVANPSAEPDVIQGVTDEIYHLSDLMGTPDELSELACLSDSFYWEDRQAWRAATVRAAQSYLERTATLGL